MPFVLVQCWVDTLGSSKKAVEYYTKALEIFKATYGDKYSNKVAIVAARELWSL